MPLRCSDRLARKAPLLVATALALGSAACAGQKKVAAPPMERFNAALCPRPPVEDTSLPLDPNLEGVKADVGVLDRTVSSIQSLRLNLTFRNGSQHGLTLHLPRQAFSLDGYQLVDHACVAVPYTPSATAKALAYSNSGPMPLSPGESATIDATMSSLAPGLLVPRGIYAIRLALKADPARVELRGRTILSDWATFAVTPAP